MPWETVPSIAWMTVAAISSWLLIDSFRSGKAIGFRWNQDRVTNPGRFWATQGMTAVVLVGAVYGLFKALEAVNLG
jgi:hypothetical protein